jgi:antitoxin (DNA-binding transcriptional repressor) of toxin-antitoxin stability system
MTTMTVTVKDMQQRLPELLSQVSSGRRSLLKKIKNLSLAL